MGDALVPPLPWLIATNATAANPFVNEPRTSVSLNFYVSKKRDSWRRRLAARNDSEWRGIVRRLADRGVRFGALGLERRGESSSAAAPADDLAAALELVHAPATSALHSTQASDWARLLWRADQHNGTSSSPNSPARGASPLLSAMLDDGFALVDDFGLDITALRREAYDALKNHGTRSRNGDLVNARTTLPSLEPLLANTSIARAIQGYLGGSARFDGYAVFNLTERATTASYPSGHWHHDRCGRRLRMFVYVHDVGIDGRPTLAARGSHRTLAYYSVLDHLSLTRFSHEYVSSRHEVVPLTGKAGGGFLLDTNMLHRASLQGGRARVAVLLEWHAHRKIPMLASHPAVMQLPCPSIKHDPTYSWKAGRPGFALYPPDAIGGRSVTPPRSNVRVYSDERWPTTKTRSRRLRREQQASPRGRTAAAAHASPMAIGSSTSAKKGLVDRAVQERAVACFARPRAQGGCAALYVVAPPPPGRPNVQSAFISLAAESARSLKRHLPTARTVLVLGGLRSSRGNSSTSRVLRGEAEGAFDEVLHWFDPSLVALASLHPTHLGWLLKPHMIAAAAATSSAPFVFFDADTLIEDEAVAHLFALLDDSHGPSFFAAPEVETSRSRRALGGTPIYNSGVVGLRMSDPSTAELLRRWQLWSRLIACTLPERMNRDPPHAPSRLGRLAKWDLATNDQFGLAQLVTPAGFTHQALLGRGFRPHTLPSAFNARDPRGMKFIAVRHDGVRKLEHLRAAHHDAGWSHELDLRALPSIPSATAEACSNYSVEMLV